MGTTDVKVRFIGDDKSLISSFGRVRGETDKTERKIGRFGGSSAKMGLVIRGALVGVAAAGLKMGRDAGQAAGDLAETVNKANVIFGKQAGEMDRWASGAAKSLGLSKKSALDAAASFGDMFGQLGFAGAQAAKMSQSVVKMSADLGSFNNLPTAEVADMMSAAFRGEYDSLQRLIPNINAARVEQEAMNLGLVKNTVDARKLSLARQTQALAEKRYTEAVKEHGKNSDEAKRAGLALAKAQDAAKKASEGAKGAITEQAKAQAVMSILQKDGKRAAGDFARTSDSLANKQKIAAATMEDLQAKIGTKLVPVMSKAVDVGMKVIDWAEQNTTTVKVLGVGTLALAGTIGLMNAAATVAAAGGLRKWLAGTKLVTGAQWLLNAALTANPVGLVIVGIAALAAGLVIAYKKSETFRTIVNGAFNTVKVGALQLAIGAVQSFRFLQNVYLSVVSALVSGAAKAFGWVPGLGPKLKTAAANVNRFKESANASLGRIERNLKVTLSTAEAKRKADELAAYYRSRNWTVTAKANVRMVYAGNGRLVPAKARGGPVNANEPTLVGEEGPELVEFRRPGLVHTAAQTRRILAAAGGGGGGGGGWVVNTYNVTVNGALDPVAVGRQLVDILNRTARGGTTQLTFGAAA